MPLRRRTLLYFLAGAGGWPLLRRGNASTTAGEELGRGSAERGQADSLTHEVPTAAASMPAERVLGIGGFFFRARDPKALAEWYRSHLGVSLTPTSYGDTGWQTEAGPATFQPFSMTSTYFGDPHQTWMLNFRVRDLERMAAQLRSSGVTVTVDAERYPNGRFARIHDPEGNPIELWEPAAKGASGS